MELQMQTTIQTRPLPFADYQPIQLPEIVVKTVTKTKSKSRGNCSVIHTEKPTSHKADAFVSREDINNIVLSELLKGGIGKACMFICGINSGYRAGDLISLKVKDITDDNGKIVDVLCFEEDKTGKSREVWLNKAFKTAAEFLIKRKNLQPENFLFKGDGNRKAYVLNFVRNDNGEIEDIKTTGERYDENGNAREEAPILVGSITRWLKGAAKEQHIDGHYSSHAMRKTFVEFISRDWNDNRSVPAACAALMHSSLDITANHYMGINPAELRRKWLSLNLGLDALEVFISKTNAQLSL